MANQTIKLTENQLRNIVNCVVKSKEEQPQVNKLVVAGEGWQYTFIILISRVCSESSVFSSPGPP
ncbi:hypothetical protein ES708_28291 [subsurface metagenome]